MVLLIPKGFFGSFLHFSSFSRYGREARACAGKAARPGLRLPTPDSGFLIPRLSWDSRSEANLRLRLARGKHCEEEPAA
jgi:hypothetical protein